MWRIKRWFLLHVRHFGHCCLLRGERRAIKRRDPQTFWCAQIYHETTTRYNTGNGYMPKISKPRMEWGIHKVTLHYSQRWNYNLWLSIIHYLLHYLQTIILHYSTLQKRDKRKLHYTSSKKQNVRSDKSSLSFCVGHCHRQLPVIGMNMYIT